MLFVLVASSVSTAALWPTANPSRLRSVSARVKSLTFEVADVKSLSEVSSFFVDAFWLASTTFDGIELSASDKKQLTEKVMGDLGPRYGIQDNDKRKQMLAGYGRKGFPNKSLFDTRLIVARDPSGAIVGCAGLEAAQGDVFRADLADNLVRTELMAMSMDEAERAAEVYKDNGIGALTLGIIEQQLSSGLVNPYINIWRPCGVLANLAVAPSYRRSGLGRALCDECERVITSEWRMDEIALQVEEANTAAITLYQKDGYKDVFRREDAVALRLQPSAGNLFGSLPGPLSALAPENKELLKEVSSPTITMSKAI